MNEPKLTKNQELNLMLVRNKLRRYFKDTRAKRHNLKDIAQDIADNIMSTSDNKPEFIKVYPTLFSA